MSAGYINPLPGVPIVESPFFDVLSEQFAGDAEVLRVARDLNRDGYAIIDFPDPGFDARAAALRHDDRDVTRIEHRQQNLDGGFDVEHLQLADHCGRDRIAEFRLIGIDMQQHVRLVDDADDLVAVHDR